MEDFRRLTFFDSGIAKPLGLSDEEARNILLSYELVGRCEIIKPTFIRVEFKKLIDGGEIFKFKRSLIGKKIRFEEKHSLKPLQS